MIDTKELKSRYDEIKKNIENRYMNINLDEIISLQDERYEILQQVETLRAKRNENAAKMKTKLEQDVRLSLIEEGKKIKAELQQKEERLASLESAFTEKASTIPNYASPKAPIGKEDKDSLAIKFAGQVKKLPFKAKDHVTLGEHLDILDFESGAKVSGQKFYYIKNKGVILQMALERYAMDTVLKHGFTPFITPDIAKEEILSGIGFNPRGEESNIYTLEGTGTCLVGTAEITLGGYYANTILEKKDLPIKMAGLSHCFRREAGGAGQYSKGLYRVHQFTKLEMFIYCLPEESEAFHEKILAIEEEIFSGLEIPYRVVDTATGDLGAPAYRKFDIEAWMPGRSEDGEYGEVTSTSNCTDYQARRLNIRYRDDDGKIKFVHMLNGTAIALSRALVAIIENYQNEDSSVSIPKVLIPYCGFDRIEK